MLIEGSDDPQWLRTGCPQAGGWSYFMAGLSSGSTWPLSLNQLTSALCWKDKEHQKSTELCEGALIVTKIIISMKLLLEKLLSPSQTHKLCLGQWFLVLVCDLVLGWLMAA